MTINQVQEKAIVLVPYNIQKQVNLLMNVKIFNCRVRWVRHFFHCRISAIISKLQIWKPYFPILTWPLLIRSNIHATVANVERSFSKFKQKKNVTKISVFFSPLIKDYNMLNIYIVVFSFYSHTNKPVYYWNVYVSQTNIKNGGKSELLSPGKSFRRPFGATREPELFSPRFRSDYINYARWACSARGWSQS